MTVTASTATAVHLRRIAVVAVHGVADPEPGASARAVADLFLRQRDGGWRAAEETALRIPIPGLPVPEVETKAAPSLRVDERSQRFRKAIDLSKESASPADVPDPSFEFMLGLFESYETPPPRTYNTPRISLTKAGVGDAAVEVDVLELYWADLSRAGQGLLRFLGELYQLLLHLPSLGRHAVDAESLRHPGDNGWVLFRELQAWVIRLLVLWIPVLNLMLLPPAAALASTVVPADRSLRVAAVLLAAAGSGLLAHLFLPAGWKWGAIGALLGLGSGAAACWTLSCLLCLEGPTVLAFEGWALSTGAALLLARFYEQLRRGAYIWARWGLLLLGLAALALLAANLEGRSLPRLGVQFLTTLFVVLRVVWFLFFILATLQIALGQWLARQGSAPARTIWTARFSLALSALSILVVTLSVWALVAKSIAPLLPTEHVDPWDFQFASLPLPNLLPLEVTAPEQLYGDFLKKLLTAAGGGVFIGALSLLLIQLGAVAVGFGPSILQEVAPPKSSPPERSKEQFDRTTNGLEFVSRSADLLSLGLILALAASVGAGLGVLSLPDTATWAAGGLLVTAVVARGWLGSARSVLDVVLDVDNYMREHPRGAGPRVAMFERTHAVLRHLDTSDKGTPGRKYDAVLFVAHSQGSVIVADFLRLAQHRRWRDDAEIPVHLMTMGCPLRQLYERCFPALYAWVGRDPMASRLTDLRLSSWTNLYRSGDYIGRDLRFRPDIQDMRESCIGIGAHTHYWDETAVAVAEELDRVVSAARAAAAS